MIRDWFQEPVLSTLDQLAVECTKCGSNARHYEANLQYAKTPEEITKLVELVIDAEARALRLLPATLRES